MSRNVALLALAACVALVAWGLWPRKARRDEDVIRALVSDCAKAAGEHDLSRLMSHVSDRYAGDFGDKPGLRSALAGYMFTARDVVAVESNVVVKVTAPTAEADFVVVLARAGTVDPNSRLGSRQIHAVLEKGADGWQVVSAKSRDAGVSDFLP